MISPGSDNGEGWYQGKQGEGWYQGKQGEGWYQGKQGEGQPRPDHTTIFESQVNYPSTYLQLPNNML